jgi:putative ABC transport system permease protein
VFRLPYAYDEKIKRIPGVEDVSYAVWFQGIYKDPNQFKNFFPRIAINPDNYFKLYPEFVVPPDQMEAFRKERNAAIIGIQTAKQQGLKIGDLIPIEGDIYPGKWQFVVRGIYKGKDKSTDETQMFFDWKYLDEALRRENLGRESTVGWYIVQVKDSKSIPAVGAAIDSTFKNSSAETLTETEKAFNKSFISMYSALFTAMNFVSFVIIGIILLVLANTMAMTARERTTEYAVLKTLGFTGRHLTSIIAGESLFIACLGGILGLLAAYPIVLGFQAMFPTLFPILPAFSKIGLAAFAAALLVGITSATFPALKAARMTIVEGLRHVG